MKSKRAVFWIAAVVVILSACGAKTVSVSAAGDSASPKPGASSPKQQAAGFTIEQLELAGEFSQLTVRFDAVAERMRAEQKLLAMPGVEEKLKFVSDSISQADSLFSSPENLNELVLADMKSGVSVCDQYIDQMQALLANYSGKETVTVAVEIQNQTGRTIYELAMSPQGSDSWGPNLLIDPLGTGMSAKTEITFTPNTPVWDMLAVVDYVDAKIETVPFIGVDFTGAPADGGTLLLSVRDGIENSMYVAGFVNHSSSLANN